MTAQISEILHYEGKTYHLATEPLQPLLDLLGDDIYKLSDEVDESEAGKGGICSACWRGYIGTWEITDDKLYIIGIKSYPGENKVFTMKHLFQGKEKVLARWYSGEIRIPYRKMLQYEHMGYMSIYEKDLFLEFRDGVMVCKREVDNTKTFNPEDPHGWNKISMNLLKYNTERLRKTDPQGKDEKSPEE